MRRRGARRTGSGSLREGAFLNVPYDQPYEDLFLAFIAGLCGFGFIPHATIEIPGSARRLDRILTLISRYRYSFHDLSRVELDAPPLPTPRFNMPFELGLAVATAKMGLRKHEWFVFEAVKHRISRSLSDLGGTDPYIHQGTPHGLLSALTNALSRSRHRPTVIQLAKVLENLKKTATIVKKDLQTDSLFDARPFHELVIAARVSAGNHIASLRRAR